MCAAITLACRRVVGRIARKYVDTVIRFSWLSRKMRQNHEYHYTEHLFVCQEEMRMIIRVFADCRYLPTIQFVKGKKSARIFKKSSPFVLEKMPIIWYNTMTICRRIIRKGLDRYDEKCDNPCQSVSQSVSQSVEHSFAWLVCQYPFCKNFRFFIRCGAPV